MAMKRPNLTAYFRSQIDRHVNGFSSSSSRLPGDVKSIKGAVTDPLIEVTMFDGTVWHWAGGRYGSRKVNLCYPPLMPKVHTPS